MEWRWDDEFQKRWWNELKGELISQGSMQKYREVDKSI